MLVLLLVTKISLSVDGTKLLENLVVKRLILTAAEPKNKQFVEDSNFSSSIYIYVCIYVF